MPAISCQSDAGYRVWKTSKTITGTGSADETNVDVSVDLAWASWMDVYIYVTPSTETGDGTVLTPTIDIDLEYSYDGTNYSDLIADFTQRTTSAAGEVKVKHRSATGPINWGPWLRFECAVGSGNTTVASYTVDFTIVAGA